MLTRRLNDQPDLFVLARGCTCIDTNGVSLYNSKFTLAENLEHSEFKD
jgi:hypothetical protein